MKLNIDPTKKYGIMLSGGLDSAVLLGLILKEYPTVQIQPFTIPKNDGAVSHVAVILNFLRGKFGVEIPNTILVGNPKAYHFAQSRIAVLEIFDKYEVDFLFNATNQNPPELSNSLGAPIRKQTTHPKILLPFASSYKDFVLKLMFENNLEELIQITHSCTELEVGRCRVCWHCAEREWAFKQLNITDTGTA